MSAVIQQHIASVLDISAHSISVEVKRCGGGYGGKLSNSEYLAGALAVAADKIGLPVYF